MNLKPTQLGSYLLSTTLLLIGDVAIGTEKNKGSIGGTGKTLHHIEEIPDIPDIPERITVPELPEVVEGLDTEIPTVADDLGEINDFEALSGDQPGEVMPADEMMPERQ